MIVCPNLDMGNLLYNLYATRFPGARKFPVMFGLLFQGVDLPMDCTPEDIRLAVKASVMRLHRYGEWQRTPKDTFFRRHRVLVAQPRLDLHQDRASSRGTRSASPRSSSIRPRR